MRLIDADALMDAFRRYMVEKHDSEKCVSEENCKTCERGCLWRKIVNNAPTIEAEPVKHGRWLPQILLGQRVWDCSECATLGSPQWKRCPVCEAKMDLEG